MNVTKESLLSKLSKRRDCYWGVGSLGTYVNESQQVWNLDTDLWHLLATLGIAQPNSSAPFPTFLEPCVELEKALRGGLYNFVSNIGQPDASRKPVNEKGRQQPLCSLASASDHGGSI